jgi:hypothetical protein
MEDLEYIAGAHQALLDDPAALTRLHELRGWTPEAIGALNLGIDDGRIVIPVTDHNDKLVGLLRYQPNPEQRNGTPKMLAAPNSSRELFPPPERLPPDATVWLVEGEADAIAAHSIGLAATACPGASAWTTDWAPRFTDRHVIVCTDCDPPGRGLAQRAADDLAETAASVRIVDLAATRDDGYDISDLIQEDPEATTDQLFDLFQGLANHATPHLRATERPPRPRVTLTQLRQAITDHLDGKRPTPAWPIPFHELREATDGGIRPGEVWVISGWTSNGKSIYADMIADTVSAAGASVHLYLTEMTIVQRGLRMIARRAGLPMTALRRGQLSDTQRTRALAAVQELPYAASIVTDWTPTQVAADIRATRTNVAIVDLLHGFDYRDERELSAIVSAFAKAATTDTSGQGGSAIILICQLNDGQMRDTRSVRRPRPGLHSLKGASWIKQRCDVVLFTYLEDDEEGRPTTTGEVFIAKNRNGGTGEPVKVELNPLSLKFEEAAA